MNKAFIYSKALELLSRREHSEKELKTKLLRFKLNSEDFKAIIEVLKSRNYLSDERFTESYILTQVRQKKGPYKIQAGLINLGIKKSLIENVMHKLAIDWMDLAREVFEKKFQKRAQNQYEIAKQIRFLLQRGFREEDFKEIVNMQTAF